MSGKEGDRTLHVESYSGYRGEETPRRIRWHGRSEEIEAILDRWLAPDHRYFKVRLQSGWTCILRHDVRSGRWDWTWFRRGGREGP